MLNKSKKNNKIFLKTYQKNTKRVKDIKRIKKNKTKVKSKNYYGGSKDINEDIAKVIRLFKDKQISQNFNQIRFYLIKIQQYQTGSNISQSLKYRSSQSPSLIDTLEKKCEKYIELLNFLFLLCPKDEIGEFSIYISELRVNFDATQEKYELYKNKLKEYKKERKEFLLVSSTVITQEQKFSNRTNNNVLNALYDEQINKELDRYFKDNPNNNYILKIISNFSTLFDYIFSQIEEVSIEKFIVKN